MAVAAAEFCELKPMAGLPAAPLGRRYAGWQRGPVKLFPTQKVAHEYASANGHRFQFAAQYLKAKTKQAVYAFGSLPSADDFIEFEEGYLSKTFLAGDRTFCEQLCFAGGRQRFYIDFEAYDQGLNEPDKKTAIVRALQRSVSDAFAWVFGASAAQVAEMKNFRITDASNDQKFSLHLVLVGFLIRSEDMLAVARHVDSVFCASFPQYAGLLTTHRDVQPQERGSPIDLAVYSKHRNLRLVWHAKAKELARVLRPIPMHDHHPRRDFYASAGDPAQDVLLTPSVDAAEAAKAAGASPAKKRKRVEGGGASGGGTGAPARLAPVAGLPPAWILRDTEAKLKTLLKDELGDTQSRLSVWQDAKTVRLLTAPGGKRTCPNKKVHRSNNALLRLGTNTTKLCSYGQLCGPGLSCVYVQYICMSKKCQGRMFSKLGKIVIFPPDAEMPDEGE